MESIAMSRAFRHYEGLQMEGAVLVENGEILAVTMGSRLWSDTFDIHFEKAREDVDGAYAAVNCEFARYLRLKYPNLRYLNREDDVGLAGLRKAKLSYNPHHMVEKSWGIWRRISMEIDYPTGAQEPQLRALWRLSFGDSEEFIAGFLPAATAPALPVRGGKRERRRRPLLV